jgi:hypothetical protein
MRPSEQIRVVNDAGSRVARICPLEEHRTPPKRPEGLPHPGFQAFLRSEIMAMVCLWLSHSPFRFL